MRGAQSMSWFALYTRHQHEKSVAQLLAAKGFEVFLPLYTTSHRWNDRTKSISLPLFSCYVFLRGGLERRSDVLTTPGSNSLVTCSGQPAAIAPKEIDDIRKTVEAGVRPEPHAFIKAGDRVRVSSGSLEGVQG